MLLADILIGGYTLERIAIIIIAIVAFCAIVYAFCQWCNVTIPAIVPKIIGIVLLAVLAIVAVKVIGGLL